MFQRAISIFAVIALATGCLEEPDCYLLNNEFVGITFKTLDVNTADNISLLSLGTVEPPLIFSGDTVITKVALPLNYFEDETTFFFETEEQWHELRLGYVSQAQFVSEDCGEKFVISRLRILEHSFDSVRLVTDIPSRDGTTTQIEIFR